MTDKTILYIEDNFHNRRIVRKILERQGYTIHESDDGIKGFNMLQELVPPVVLLDISLPGMDGIEIAKKVKADNDLKHIILIALTASAMQGDRERFLAAGCDDYLSKPFRAVNLVEVVNHHFDNLPEQPVKTEAPPLASGEQDDDTAEFAVPDIPGLEKTGSTKPLDISLDTDDLAAPVSEEIVEQEAKPEEFTEPAAPADMSLDRDDLAAPVSEEIVEQEAKPEEFTEPAAPADMSLDRDDLAAPVSEEIVEQEAKPEKRESAEAITPIETKASIEGNTKPLNELEAAAHEYLENKEGAPTIVIHEKPKDLDRKAEKVTKTEPPGEIIKPKAKSKTKAAAKTTKAKTKPKPKAKTKAKTKTTKAKTKPKPKAKTKAKTKTTKAKTKAKPKAKAKTKTAKPKSPVAAKSKTESKTKTKVEIAKVNDPTPTISTKQAEKAAPVRTSLKADDRTRPLWGEQLISTEAEIVPASNSDKPSPSAKPERKVNETEGAPIEEITDTIIGMINSKILKPVDPNGNLNAE